MMLLENVKAKWLMVHSLKMDNPTFGIALANIVALLFILILFYYDKKRN
jgi:hypothetical protein